MKAERDVWWHDAVDSCADECEAEWVDSETPLFMLYTSGSTGKPKGQFFTPSVIRAKPKVDFRTRSDVNVGVSPSPSPSLLQASCTQLPVT